MILPVYALGHPVLKKVCDDIDSDYPELEELISNMWETMYHSEGVGLAAPQIGRAIRLFVIDTAQILDEDKKDEGIKKVFINAEILEETGTLVEFEEGCLSIPKIRGNVSRHPNIVIRYMNESFKEKTESFNGMNARVIQHEYDHTEGITFNELLKPLKKRKLKKQLDQLIRGDADADYKMVFAKKLLAKR